MAIVFITHNLGVVAEIADRVMVMYAGRIVEEGGVVPVLRAAAACPTPKASSLSVPRLGWSHDGREELAFIPGAVPDAHRLPPGLRVRATLPPCRPGPLPPRRARAGGRRRRAARALLPLAGARRP